MKPVLITGLMGSGKTSVANRLINEYAYPKLSMAAWIKSTVAAHYGVASIDKTMSFNGKSVRTILQEVGMYIRKVDPSWHIDEVLNKIKRSGIKLFVIDDIRFINEANRIREQYDCIIIKVECNTERRLERILERDLVVPTERQLNDSSEVEVDSIKPDYTISNNGTLNELFTQIDYIIRSN